ncbi:hypothetical protein U1Q18_027856, partial [Sarracenia purpurea var. burkii]
AHKSQHRDDKLKGLFQEVNKDLSQSFSQANRELSQSLVASIHELEETVRHLMTLINEVVIFDQS